MPTSPLPPLPLPFPPSLIPALARTALANVVTEYPYKLDQLLAGH